MFDRLVEIFCEVDDFCKVFRKQYEEHLLGEGPGPQGPEPGLCDSEIITILLILHNSGFKHLKGFYNSPWGAVLRQDFPGMPCYERFVSVQKPAFAALAFFTLSRMGQRRGVYYIDSTALPVCHNRRINRHKTFTELAARGKTTMGWFFGFKLHLVFNHQREIVALKPGFAVPG